MAETIELRLVHLAQQVADMYKNKIPTEQFEQLYDAIKICRDYHIEGKNHWGNMYEVVLGEDGIWEYELYEDIEKDIAYMWGLEVRILMCNCWLGCTREHDGEPQNMEMRGENIPEFVELLEKNVAEEINYIEIFESFNSILCY